jgi:hypothetical protein
MSPCPDWELAEDGGWFLAEGDEVEGELVLAQANLLEALERNAEIMLHPKFTGHCPECGFEFERCQPVPVHWKCDHWG